LISKVKPMAVVRLAREMRAGVTDERPLVVAGARELVPLLARELRAGGDAAAVREGGDSEGAAALVWVGEPDEQELRKASRADIPIIAVTDANRVPYVFDTHLVQVRPGEGFPIDRIAQAVARALGERAAPLAARLPVVREAVVEDLVKRFSRRNGFIGVAVFVPGVDLPILTLNQIRLVLRIAMAHGQRIDVSRSPELLAIIGAGLGFRTVAREAVGAVPALGWAIKGGIAYAGTKAIGEAAHKYFDARST
jgi:uncharacterized protein (DUF697 family)